MTASRPGGARTFSAMNLRELLPGIPEDLRAAVAPVTPVHVDLASPLAPVNNLARVLDGVVLQDVFGAGVSMPVTRAEAMTVPAVARARHIIAGTMGAVPIRRYGRDGQPLADQGWASPTVGTVSMFHRHLWTADDFLFYGWSCWARVNSAPDPRTGRTEPLRMDRIPWGRWSVDEVGRVMIDNGTGVHVLVDQRSVILLPGPHEGILTAAAVTIRHAADLQRAAATAARTPAAYMALRQVQGAPLKLRSADPEEVTVETTLADWRAARAGLGGGVAFVPLGLVAEELGTFSEHLLTEGRNAAAVDVARVTSLPADLLDAAGPSSLTYSNARDNDVRAIQYGVGLYMRSLSAALSMDAVTPRGQTVRFDLDEWLESPIPAASSPASAPPTADVSRETTPQELPA